MPHLSARRAARARPKRSNPPRAWWPKRISEDEIVRAGFSISANSSSTCFQPCSSRRVRQVIETTETIQNNPKWTPCDLLMLPRNSRNSQFPDLFWPTLQLSFFALDQKISHHQAVARLRSVCRRWRVHVVRCVGVAVPVRTQVFFLDVWTCLNSRRDHLRMLHIICSDSSRSKRLIVIG